VLFSRGLIMKEFFVKFCILLLSIHLLTLVLTGVRIIGGLEGILWATFVYFILDSFIRPILKIVLFPIHLLTLSASLWVMDIILFILWTFISPSISMAQSDIASIVLGPIRIGSFHLLYWQSLVVGGILIRLLIKFLEWIIE
jgi:uncharacterized membrane protein YvlD (DUF360 family)